MLEGNLNTTNLFLGIIAAVSLLQALVIVGVAIAGYRLYSRVMQTVAGIEERQIAPLVARVETLMSTVDGILGDVKGLTGRVRGRTEQVDAAIDDTIHRVDETAGRVRASVSSRIHGLMGMAQGVAAVVQSLLHVRRAA
jgi:methyl-accepting chemotaxis protein